MSFLRDGLTKLAPSGVTDATGPLVQSYDNWRAVVGSTALLLQAYLSSLLAYLARPGAQMLSEPNDGARTAVIAFVLSFLAFVVSAGLIYSVYIKSLFWIYRRLLWFRFNKRFAIFGHWDLDFQYERKDGLDRSNNPEGYIFIEQDYLGNARAVGFYDLVEDKGGYQSEFVMSGTPVLDGDRPSFRFLYRTTHSENAGAGADVTDGVELVTASTISKKNGFPTRLVGLFAEYRRHTSKPLWRGQTRYSRHDDLSIRHQIHGT